LTVGICVKHFNVSIIIYNFEIFHFFLLEFCAQKVFANYPGGRAIANITLTVSLPRSDGDVLGSVETAGFERVLALARERA
jgi:hypothetical protein